MENEKLAQEPITITLSVQQWTAILNCLSLAPFSAVNQIAEAVNALQVAAGPQVEAAAQKHAQPTSEGVAVSE